MNKDISEINRKAWNQIVTEGKTIHVDLGEKEKKFMAAFTRNLPKNADVLDLGCGTGIPLGKILYDLNFKVTGVDVSDQMIKRYKKNLPNSKTFRMPMTDIKWTNKFDGILSSYSLLCLPLNDFSTMSKKITKALRKNGLFLMFLNEGDSKDGQIQEVQGQQMFSTGVSEKEIRDMFEPNGMKIIKIDREKCYSQEYGIEHEMMFLMEKR